MMCGYRVFKGEVYERNIFTIKDIRFKSDSFLDEVKRSYTELINIYVRDDKEKLKVFDKNGVYLPMKKVGKNNPKAEQIEADNRVRTMWNQMVDRAFVSGVPEEQILEVKQSEIGQKAKVSIQKSGRNPALFKSLIMTAIYALELLISKVVKMALEKANKVTETFVKSELEQTKVRAGNELVMAKSEPIPEMPKKSKLASEFLRLADIYSKLEKQNAAIYQREQQLASVEKKIAGTKGIFKGKQRNKLQEQAEQLRAQIASMKQYLSSIVQGYGYKNVKEFLAEYRSSKAEYNDYQSAVARWEMYKIREAFKSDCDGIGKVYCDSWKTAYQNLLSQTYLDLLTVEDCTPDKVSEREVVLVGYGSVLGICHISEARDRDNKVWGEVVAIYLLPEIWGSGQGSELLRYALGKLKKNGFRNICLWVMKGNIRARKFYEKNGFQISGKEREIEIAECRVSEVEYIYYG